MAGVKKGQSTLEDAARMLSDLKVLVADPSTLTPEAQQRRAQLTSEGVTKAKLKQEMRTKKKDNGIDPDSDRPLPDPSELREQIEDLKQLEEHFAKKNAEAQTELTELQETMRKEDDLWKLRSTEHILSLTPAQIARLEEIERQVSQKKAAIKELKRKQTSVGSLFPPLDEDKQRAFLIADVAGQFSEWTIDTFEAANEKGNVSVSAINTTSLMGNQTTDIAIDDPASIVRLTGNMKTPTLTVDGVSGFSRYRFDDTATAALMLDRQGVDETVTVYAGRTTSLQVTDCIDVYSAPGSTLDLTGLTPVAGSVKTSISVDGVSRVVVGESTNHEQLTVKVSRPTNRVVPLVVSVPSDQELNTSMIQMAQDEAFLRIKHHAAIYIAPINGNTPDVTLEVRGPSGVALVPLVRNGRLTFNTEQELVDRFNAERKRVNAPDIEPLVSKMPDPPKHVTVTMNDVQVPAGIPVQPTGGKGR